MIAFRLAQDASQTRSPFFDQAHMMKDFRDHFVARFGVSFQSVFQSQTSANRSGGSYFDPVVKNGNLYRGIVHVVPMTDGVDDHFTHGGNGDLVFVFTHQAFDFRPHFDIVQNEIVSVFDLLI